MKLGISRPRREPYVPRPIDGKATKQARTRHAAGVKRLQDLFFGAQSIPAPGSRTGHVRKQGAYHSRLRPRKGVRRAIGKAQRQARKANR